MDRDDRPEWPDEAILEGVWKTDTGSEIHFDLWVFEKNWMEVEVLEGSMVDIDIQFSGPTDINPRVESGLGHYVIHDEWNDGVEIQYSFDRRVTEGEQILFAKLSGCDTAVRFIQWLQGGGPWH